MDFPETIQKEGPSLLEYAEAVAKASTELGSADQQEVGKVSLCLWEMPEGGLAQAPTSNLIQSFPVSIGETHPQRN